MISIQQIGDCENTVSAEKIFNRLIKTCTGHEMDVFAMNPNLECGTLAKGMVQLGWFLPSEQSNHLHSFTLLLSCFGSSESLTSGFQNLLHGASTLPCLMISQDRLESMTSASEDFQCLKSFLEICKKKQKIYRIFIFNPFRTPIKREAAFSLLKELFPTSNLDKMNIKTIKSDAKEAVRSIISILKNTSDSAKTYLSDLTLLYKPGMEFDGSVKTTADASNNVTDLLNLLPNQSVTWQKRHLKLQRLWKKYAKYEKKDLHDDPNDGMDIWRKKDMFHEKMTQIRKQQVQLTISPIITSFLKQLTGEDSTSNMMTLKVYFNLLKNRLDSLSFQQIMPLKEKHKKISSDLKKIQSLDLDARKKLTAESKAIVKQISDSSLGLEYLVREIGQLYEAHCGDQAKNNSMISNTNIDPGKLPEVMVELLLKGEFIEILDGDAGHVPKEWMRAIFETLEKRIGHDKRIFILSVLGVQGSGKSTMLNTMFGIQFPVSSGRCTKGVYGQLVPSCKSITPDIDYILVLDTEGLRAPELKDDSPQSLRHDHEIATFACGLADLTIINMIKELVGDMHDVLQIVIYAFLRLSQVDERLNFKPSAIFVHHNMTQDDKNDVVYINNQLQSKLDDLTVEAAEHEHISNVTGFTDVVDVSMRNDLYCIAQLFQGDPPMASINPRYAQDVAILKSNIQQFMNIKSHSIHEVKRKVEDLWMGILKEDFVFHFQGGREVRAYSDLEKKLFNLKNEMKIATENKKAQARNQIENTRHPDLNRMENEILQKYDNDSKEVYDDKVKRLKNFINQRNNRHIMEKWKVGMLQDIKEEHRSNTRNFKKALDEKIDFQKQKLQNGKNLDMQKERYIQLAINIASQLQDRNLSEEEIEEKFEDFWRNEIKMNISQTNLQKDKELIDFKVNQRVRKSISSEQTIFVTQAYEDVKKLKFEYTTTIVFDRKLIPTDSLQKRFITGFFALFREKRDARNDPNEILGKLKDVFNETNTTLQEFQNKGFDENSPSCVLQTFDERIRSLSIPMDSKFFVRSKIYIGEIMKLAFFEFHEEYKTNVDPSTNLETFFKPELLSIFKNQCLQTNFDLSAAKALSQCIEARIVNALSLEMPQIIANELQTMPCFQSTRAFQIKILTILAEHQSFESYRDYLGNSSLFSGKAIKQIVNEKLFNTSNRSLSKYAEIEKDHIECIYDQIKKGVETSIKLSDGSLSDFIETFKDQENVRQTIPLGTALDPIYKTYKVKDMRSFIKYLLSSLNESKIKLKSISETKTASNMKRGRESTYSLLYKQCSGCLVQCPFCRAQCSHQSRTHPVKHSSIQHRSQGMGKYRNKGSSVLVLETCPMDVASTKKRFQNRLTRGASFRYREYDKVYKDWDIPADATLECSMYWKWVFVTFCSEFADEYGCVEPDIPESWRSITKEDAIGSLAKFLTMY